ncbi:MAG: phosphate acetyltransferase [Clostridia bacterium]|nr:phosphate acetyltransferase [Clostridia bacterium]
MSQLIESYKEKVRKFQKTIVLPEGHDQRVIDAAEMISTDGFAKIIILGDEQKVRAMSKNGLPNVKIINPKTSEKLEEYANFLYELRKAKGMTIEQARTTVQDEMYYGVMMVKMGEADGMVGGACHATSELLRPALQIIKTRPGIKAVSGFFIMYNPDNTKYPKLLFADCAVTPVPTSEELADFAVCSDLSAKQFLGVDPKIAMLSFSTKGSAKHDDVTVVAEATRIVKERAPEITVDGEIQFDAAVVPEVGKLKCPGSPVAGQANVFIFPDLNAGNIGYKIAQRLGNYKAYGPICQGMAKPVNDLSRGCVADDIVGVVAMTAVQSME